MTSFHVNGNGEPGKCSAQKGNCPFGGENDHHASASEARAAYEAQQGANAIPAPRRAVSKPGQLPFLNDLDNAYNGALEAREQGLPGRLTPNPDIDRSANEAQVDEFSVELEKIVADHRESFGTVADKTEEDRARTAYVHDNWRKGMLDMLENRTGERLSGDASLVLEDGRTVVTADEFGSGQKPGEYSATYRDENGNGVPVKVAVYGDGSSRAFLPDYRDDLEHRKALVEPTRQGLVDALPTLQETSGKSEVEARATMLAADAVAVALHDGDWSTPEGASDALGAIYDAEETLWDEMANGEISDEDEKKVKAIAEKLGDLQANAYVMGGRQKLAPMPQATPTTP